MTPIETRDELVAWFAAGIKPKSQFASAPSTRNSPSRSRGVARCPMRAGAASGRCSRACSNLLGWEPIIEDGNIIGLFDVTGGGAISLEPGGQFELSGAPVETVHQTSAELMAHRAQVKEVARPLGIGFSASEEKSDWSAPCRSGTSCRAELPTWACRRS